MITYVFLVLFLIFWPFDYFILFSDSINNTLILGNTGSNRNDQILDHQPVYEVYIYSRRKPRQCKSNILYTVNLVNSHVRNSWNPHRCEYFSPQYSPCHMAIITRQVYIKGLIMNSSRRKQVYLQYILKQNSLQIKVGLKKLFRMIDFSLG